MRFVRYSPSKTDDVTQEMVRSPMSRVSELSYYLLYVLYGGMAVRSFSDEQLD